MPNLSHEKQHGRDNGRIICGVDEAGRGPLAGPVMAAAVILPAKLPRGMQGKIRDSKKMTLEQREEIYAPLTECCLYAVAEASVEEISRFNILWASMLAMQRAVESLGNVLRKEQQNSPPPFMGEGLGAGVRLPSRSSPESLGIDRSPAKRGRGASLLSPQSSPTKIHTALIDGNRCPQLECKTVAIIEGDDKSLSIAAASIIAKVTRDRLMRKLAAEHPGYGWEHNMGYGTREHIAALRQLGATPWHRPSFAPVMQLDMDV